MREGLRAGTDNRCSPMESPRKPHIVVAESFQSDVTDRLEKHATVRVMLDASPEELREAIRDADALMVRNRSHITAGIIDSASHLRVIGRAGSSLDHIDIKAAQRKGVTVVYTPLAQVKSAAEFTVALIFACGRRIPWYDRKIRENQFESLRTPYGREFSRITLGLFGGGPVAEEVARVFSTAFGTRILSHAPTGTEPVATDGTQTVDVETLLKESDVVSLHLPGSDGRQRYLGEQQLRLMKPTAHVINTSRGSAIDYQALGDALKTKRLGGAAIDVFDAEPLPLNHPLRNAPCCILTPHVAAATLDVHEAYLTVADDILRVLKGESPKYPAPLRGR